MSPKDLTPEDPTFLSRWMRRKGEASESKPTNKTNSVVTESRAPSNFLAEEVTPEPQLPTTVSDPGEIEIDPAKPGEKKSAKPVLVDSDMPPIESLTEASDFGQFMSPGVSEVLRKAALRKLFRLPVFGVRDGLDDYDEDFRTFAALGNIITADMKFEKGRFEERMREKIEKRRLEGEEIDAETEEQLVSEAGRAALPKDAPDLDEDVEDVEDEDEDEDGETDEEALA